MKKKKNVLFLLIDALRYDVFSDMDYARRIAPNLTGLVDRGFVRRVVNNGHATKFVMPSLFTQTYPLDHGGYNRGIGARPKSYVELLRDAGYDTRLVLGHDLDGPLGGVERGFNEVAVFYDVDLPLHSYLRDMAPHEIGLWQRGEISQSQLVETLQRDMDLLLAQAESSINRPVRQSLRSPLGRTSRRKAGACRRERELLANEPMAVVEKIRCVPPNFYRYCLGKRRPGPSVFLRRVGFAVKARIQRFLRRYLSLPLQFLSHRMPPVAGELIDYAAARLTSARKPWFFYIHVMDLHDCAIPSRPFNFLRRMFAMPRVLVALGWRRTPRSLLYDSALAYVDGQVGKLLRQIEASGQAEDTIVMATGDHGLIWERERDPAGAGEFGFRTHYEFIDVPLILVGQDKKPAAGGLLDSMSVSATLLDVLEIDGHPSFKGRSAFAGGSDVVINENAGRGNADLDRSDLFFTVVTVDRKLMAVLRGSELQAERFYDICADPKELHNMVNDAGRAEEIRALTDRLFAARGELFARRGIVKNCQPGAAVEAGAVG